MSVSIHPSLKHLSKRSRLPAISVGRKRGGPAVPDPAVPDPANVQGDVYLGIPKGCQAFIFFIIDDASKFRQALQSYQPTSSADVTNALQAISASKDSGGGDVDIIMTQIAFSQLGLKTLGIGKTGDTRFDAGSMLGDRKFLGDQGPWDSVFDPATIHGVIMVCAKSQDKVDSGVQTIKDTFSASWEIKQTLSGNARPGKYKGKEHFGYQDGVSQPSLRGLTTPHRGQLEADPGVLILGYPGDPLVDNPLGPQRPDWARDGSFMVFRKLEQDVKGWNNFVAKSAKYWQGFTPVPDEIQPPFKDDDEKANFVGAALVGRWKSGAPIQLAHFRDDPSLATEDNANNFDYSVPGVVLPTNRYCPFNSHTRKTAPRNLDPYLTRKYLELSLIARSGIPYGKEIDVAPTEERGLLFVCYQSALDNGFVRQTVGFSSNDFFPTTDVLPQNHGQDPITGSNPKVTVVDDAIALNKKPESGQVTLAVVDSNTSEKYLVTGFPQQVNDTVDKYTPDFFVTSHGGEYFFVPSIPTLTAWSKAPTTTKSKLDIMFLIDATGSMDPYIKQASASIGTIYDNVLRNGSWSKDDIRVGLVAFRDHPQKKATTFLTQKYDFTSDMSKVSDNLDALEAKDGEDYPEASEDALEDALEADWNDDAVMVTVLITDSTPHATGESHDYFKDGCPDQNDPVDIADRMADLGIVLYVLGCEPKLSAKTAGGIDFYTGITAKTGGKLLTLNTANIDQLGDIIVGMASDTSDSELAVSENTSAILKRKGDKISDIANDLHKQLTAKGVKHWKFTMSDVYSFNSDAKDNVKVWFEAKKLDQTVRDKIKSVKGNRVNSDYRKGERPTVTLEKEAISYDQVEALVTKCLRRSK